MTDTDFSSLNVLVVDDEVFMRQLIVRVLTEIGVKQIYDAENGNEGVTTLKNFGRTIDLVLCDLEMPEMDGFEFVRQVRGKADVPNPDIPVLIVSGHTDEDHIRKAVELGIHGFVAKPVSRKLLEDRITAALTSSTIDPSLLGGQSS